MHFVGIHTPTSTIVHQKVIALPSDVDQYIPRVGAFPSDRIFISFLDPLRDLLSFSIPPSLVL